MGYFDDQEADITRKQKLASMLMQNSPSDFQTINTGRFVVPNLGVIGDAFRNYKGKQLDQEATQQLSDLTKQKSARLAGLLSQGMSAFKDGNTQGAMQIFGSDPSTAPYAQAIMKSQLAQNKPIDLGDVSKFTPESVQKYQQSKNYGDLVPIQKTTGDVALAEAMGFNLATPEGRKGLADYKRSAQQPRGNQGDFFGNTIKTVGDDGQIHAYQLGKDGKPAELSFGGQKIVAETPWDKRALDTQAKGDQVQNAEDIKRDEAFIDDSVKAYDALVPLQRMKELNGLISHGKTAEAYTAAGDVFGVTPANEGEFRDLSRSQVLSVIKMLGANPTDTDRGFIESMSAKLGKGEEVNQRDIDRGIELLNRRVYRGQEAARARKKDWHRMVGAPEDFTPKPKELGAPAPAAQTKRLKFNPATGELE